MRKALSILACVLLAGAACATTYTLTTPGNTAWSTTANWTPNGNPGAASGDSAYLTNSTLVGTNILSITPVNALTAVALSNSTGHLVLDVTNCTLNTTALNLYNNGIIEIDNGGVLTNTTPTIYGANNIIYLNTGGQWNGSATLPVSTTSTNDVLCRGTWGNGNLLSIVNSVRQ